MSELYDANCEKLIEIFFQGKGIQSVFNKTYELLGRPVILCDAGFKLLYYAGDMRDEDPYWRDMVTKGHFSYQSVSTLIAQKIFEGMINSSSPIYYGKDIFDSPRMGSKVMVDNKVVGFLVMMECEKSFGESDSRVFSLLCDIISSEMQKSKFTQNSKGYIYESFITDLLEGREMEQATVNDRMKSLNLNLKEYTYVIAIHTAEAEGSANQAIQYFRNVFEQFLSGSKSILYNDTIILIISRNKKIDEQQKDIQSFVEFMAKNNMHAGISRCFHTIVHLQEYYLQAVKSLEYGMLLEKGRNLYFYEEFVLYHLLDICQSKKSLSDFCHEAIFTLIQYDQMHNTNYMKTLSAYISNEKKILETANELQIHRNTLTSRIQSIEEIMGVNLNEIETVFHLFLSFKILRFQQK